MHNTILVIAGPTASGKTSTGFELAKKFGNPIISADSRAIYKGLNIGAAKPTIDAHEVFEYQDAAGLVVEIDGLKHYLINVADLTFNYTVKNWIDDAKKVIDFYHSKNITPIIVGGTGLYIEALLKGYQFPTASIIPDWKRSTPDRGSSHYLKSPTKEQLTPSSSGMTEMSLKEKLAQLKKLDPKTYQKIDKQNPARIERALAYTLQTGKSFIEAQKSSPPNWQSKTIFIDHPRDILYNRIDDTLEKRFQMGMIDEVSDLLKQGFGAKLKNLGLEYKFITQHLEDELSLQEMKEKLKFAIHAFARRQLTWWRKRENITYVNSPEQAFVKAQEFLRATKK